MFFGRPDLYHSRTAVGVKYLLAAANDLGAIILIQTIPLQLWKHD